MRRETSSTLRAVLDGAIAGALAGLIDLVVVLDRGHAAELLDAVLVFDNLGELLTDRPTGGVNLPAALRPALEEGRVRLVGELRDELVDAADRHHGGFLGNFTRVRLDALLAASRPSPPRGSAPPRAPPRAAPRACPAASR